MRRSNFAIDTFRASNLDLHKVLSSKSLSPYRSRYTVCSNENYYSIADVYGAVGGDDDGEGGPVNLREAVLGPLKEMLDFSLLKRLSFSLLVFATVCTMMG